MPTDATLALANQHIDEARDRIARQRALIARLQAGGHPVATAEALLETFEEVYEGMVEHRDRVDIARQRLNASPHP